MLLETGTYTQRLGLWTAWLAFSVILVCRSNRAPGKARLALALPLLGGNLLVPLLFDPFAEFCTVIVATFATAWLTSFKVLAWALNRGALTVPLSPLQFAVVYVFPVTPAADGSKPAGAAGAAAAARSDNTQATRQGARSPPTAAEWGRWDATPGTPAENAVNFVTKCVALTAICYALAFLQLPRLVNTFLCGMGLYCFLGLLMDGPAALATAAIGLRISPHFDEPYKSASLSEFWNRRFNRAAGGVLRALIYDPINTGHLVYDPKAPSPRKSPLRRALAVCATFLASGVMHELVFWYLSGSITGYWLAYFGVQAPLIMAEAALKAGLGRQGITVPNWLAIPVTVLTVVVVADRMFLPPVEHLGIASRLIHRIWSAAAGAARAVARGAGELELGWALVDVAAPLVKQA